MSRLAVHITNNFENKTNVVFNYFIQDSAPNDFNIFYSLYTDKQELTSTMAQQFIVHMLLKHKMKEHSANRFSMTTTLEDSPIKSQFCQSDFVRTYNNQRKLYEVKIHMFIEEVNEMKLLRRQLPTGRIISIDISGGGFLKGGRFIAHLDMNNSNNCINNLEMVNSDEAIKLLMDFEDDGGNSGHFLFIYE